MSDTSSTETNEPLDPNIRQALRKHEEVTAERDALAARLAELERKDAFREAGIPLDKPVSELFVKAYDGPVEPAAIKEAAEKYGILNSTPAPPAPAADDLAAQRQIASANPGASEPTGAADLAARIRAAKTPEEVLALSQGAETADPNAWRSFIFPEER